ncbi:unnamed protein product, partial [Allacma fusca]
ESGRDSVNNVLLIFSSEESRAIATDAHPKCETVLCMKPTNQENFPLTKKGMKENSPVSGCTLFFTLLSMMLYLLDTVLDVKLAYDYYRDGYMTYFGLTIGFLLVPGIFILAVNINLRRFPNYYHPWQNVLSHVLNFLLFGPVYRDINILYFGTKNRQKSNGKEGYYHYRTDVEEHFSCELRLFERFLEQGPQVTLQMFIWLRHPEFDRILIGKNDNFNLRGQCSLVDDQI